jgi:hypothetical protein
MDFEPITPTPFTQQDLEELARIFNINPTNKCHREPAVVYIKKTYPPEQQGMKTRSMQ